MSEADPRFYEFGPFRLDSVERLLLRDGQPVPLTEKVFDLLVLLVQNRGRALGKTELMDRLWPDTVVEENNLTVNMSLLRKALGEAPSERRFIETLPRRGYRFVASVTQGEARAVSPLVSLRHTGVRFTGRGEAPNGGAPRRLFVGRDRELSRLEQRLESAVGGSGRVIFVTGAPGMGKTELCEQFRARVCDGDALLFATGQCFEHHGAKEAYAPFFEMIGALLSGPHGDEVRRTIERHAPTWFVHLAGTRVDSGLAALGEARGVDAARMVREMADAIQALTLFKPLLLVLEDLHWADPSSLDLLRLIAHRIGGFRALVLGTFRAEQVELENEPLKNLRRELLAHDGCEEIPLPLLEADSVASYIDARFARHELPRELSELVHRRTEGQPLFATRLVQLLVERGDVLEVAGRWVLARPVSELELGVPSNVRGLIERKFESVDEADRRALQYASVVGVEFTSAVLAGLLSEDEIAVDERLNELSRRHRLITLVGEEQLAGGQTTTRYRFAHVLYQNVLYEGLAAKRRMALHGQVAEHLLAQNRASLQRIFAQLALHFERARNFRRAIEYWIEAADHAGHLYADAQAADHIRHALELLDKVEPDDRVGLRIILLYNHAWNRFNLADHAASLRHFEAMLRYASAPEFTGAGEQAERARASVFDYFERSWRDLSGVYDIARMPNQDRSLGPAAIQCEAYWALCCVLAESNRLDELSTRVEQYRRIAEATNNEPRRAEALAWMAARQLKLANFREVLRLADESTRISLATGHVRTLSLSVHFRARAEYRAAEYEASEAGLKECLARTFEAQCRVACLLDLGRVRTRLADVAGALEALDEARDIAERKGRDEWLQSVADSYGDLYRELGELERATEQFSRGLEIAERLRAARLEIHFLLHLGHVYTERSELDRAGQAFDRAERLVSGATSGLFEIPLQRHDFDLANQWARAEFRLALRELDAAEAHAGQLLDIASAAGAVRHIAIAQHVLARADLARGDFPAAREHANAGLGVLGGCVIPFLRGRLRATLDAARRVPARSGASFDQISTSPPSKPPPSSTPPSSAL